MKYELTILAQEETTEAELDSIKKTIEKYATIEKFENAGTKRLAYSIKGHERADYLYYNLEMEREDCAKLASELNFKGEVLRYLLMRACEQ